MDRLVTCNNVFDHRAASAGRTTAVGEVLRISPEEAEQLTRARLARPLSGDVADEGPGDTLIYHKGGGWYLVAGEGGRVLGGENPVQGREKAEAKAEAHADRKEESSES
jgi:hypothetical protein